MKLRNISTLILNIIMLGMFVSCAHISRRMPAELDRMHEFLTRDDPRKCFNYHYNFERQAPRLFHEHQLDSILDIIEYIKTECGPSANLEVARMLLLADTRQFGDSLIGSSTIPQMLWFRSEKEYLLNWQQLNYLYGWAQPIDNTHENFTEFETEVAQQVSDDTAATPTERAIGLFYSDSFDSAFSYIQSDEMKGTKLRKSYNDFVGHVKRMYPSRANVGFSLGWWSPRGNNSLLGNHPDIGLQIGGEGKWWRADLIFNYRFIHSKSKFQVDSLGRLVSTDKFRSLLFGFEGGFKFFDNTIFSTDIFAGVGYDMMFSITEAGDPDKSVSHGLFAASIGLRQRFFLNQRSGLYLGSVIRYGLVDYDNPGGTDLSGNTLTVSLVCGWSLHETLYQFLEKLNYKGNWRR